MTSHTRTWSLSVAVIVFLTALASWPQAGTVGASKATTESIGDVVKAEDGLHDSRPIHIIYVHGINQIGAGDSMLLRKSICKYLQECDETHLDRVYADKGPFAVGQSPPKIGYMGEPIWKTPESWSASAPFMERYKLVGHGHPPVMLDEYNWWPLAYPVKCKWLIPHDAFLTGPSKEQIDICSVPAGNQEDPDHPGRYLAYRWMETSEAAELKHTSRHAAILNRSLKNGLMDWGFGDAVMALGPMQEIITAGIRQLLRKSLEAAGADVQSGKPQENGPEFFLITHSLGSYLSLAAIDSDWLGPQSPDLHDFAISAEDRLTVDYFSAHASGFYFLANQLGLLELAGLSAPTNPPQSSSSSLSEGGQPTAITHWLTTRQNYLEHHSSAAPLPQIIAWSDPNDLLSWDVPQIEGAKVVNMHVHNPGFRLAPFLVSPTAAHANYGKNSHILSRIFKPRSKKQNEPQTDVKP